MLLLFVPPLALLPITVNGLASLLHSTNPKYSVSHVKPKFLQTYEQQRRNGETIKHRSIDCLKTTFRRFFCYQNTDTLTTCDRNQYGDYSHFLRSLHVFCERNSFKIIINLVWLSTYQFRISNTPRK